MVAALPSPPPSIIDPALLQFGSWRMRLSDRATPGGGAIPSASIATPRFGLVVAALDGESAPPADYVNEILLAPEHREAFFALVDHHGLVVCKGVGGDDALHRGVRGRSSRGRLSQGEYFHHDGCSGPIKPRVVEIRCPYQEVARHTFTAIAPFPDVVVAMLLELPEILRTGELAALHAEIVEREARTGIDWDLVQGTINRAVRRALPAEPQRAYLRQVDVRIGAYREPWEMGESRFIANRNAGRTMQHRRAYLELHSGKRPNGHLLKRWPAELELTEDACEL